MLTELLSSSGIEAWFEGAVASCLGPLIPGAGGGARLLVPAAHAERARELIAASGVFRGDDAGACIEPDAGARVGRVAFGLYPLVVMLIVVGATLARMALG